MTVERTRYFKHIFAGSERIATKPCGEPCRTKGGGIPLVPVEAPPVKDSLVMNTQSLPSPPPVSIRDSLWSTYLSQTANCLGVQRQNLLLDFRINSLEARTTPINENTTYFYHPDHLGSTGYLSTHLQNGHARITQHYQYTPFGEAFVHQKYWQNTAQFNHQNPYEFNGKEKDIETGYNYYGARHYNASWGVWLGVDPLADHPNQIDKSPYAAFWNNPIRYNDPDGRCPECRENIKNPADGQSYKSTGGAEYIFGNGDWTRQGGTLHEVVVTASGNRGRDFGGNSPSLGDFGTGLSLAGEGMWLLGENRSRSLYQQGFRRGLSGNYQLTGRNLSLFGNRPMTSWTKPISRLTPIGKTLSGGGTALSVVSLGFDVANYSSGNLDGSRLGYRATGTGASIGAGYFLGGPYGAAVGGLFFLGEKAWDMTQPMRDEISRQFWQFENALRSGWRPR